MDHGCPAALAAPLEHLALVQIHEGPNGGNVSLVHCLNRSRKPKCVINGLTTSLATEGWHGIYFGTACQLREMARRFDLDNYFPLSLDRFVEVTEKKLNNNNKR
jgi:hypothetical protein